MPSRRPGLVARDGLRGGPQIYGLLLGAFGVVLLRLAARLTLAFLPVLLRQGLAKGAQAVAQRLQRLGLPVQRAGQVIFAQGLFGLAHGAAGVVKRLPPGLA